MSRIVTIRKQIASYLLERVPALKRVEIIAGGLRPDDLDKIVTTNGTLHMAFLGTQTAQLTTDGTEFVPISYGAFISHTGTDRLDKGIAIMEAVLGAVVDMPVEALDVPLVLQPQAGVIENLYSGRIAQSPAIFGCSFVVPVLFERDTFSTDLIEFPEANSIEIVFDELTDE